MTTQEEPYADEVAPEPLYSENKKIRNAEGVLRWQAVFGLCSDTNSWHYGTGPLRREDPSNAGEVKRLRWLMAFYQETGAFNLHLLLSRLRDVDPAAADEVAEAIIDFYEGGDSYGELLWQWVTEHGIDADRITAEHKAWLAQNETKFDELRKPPQKLIDSVRRLGEQLQLPTGDDQPLTDQQHQDINRLLVALARERPDIIDAADLELGKPEADK